MKNKHIRRTFLIVLVTALCTGLLMLLIYQRTSRSLSDELEASYSVVADKYALELTAWINTNATIIEALAAEITVSGIYDSDYEAFHQFLSDNWHLLNSDGFIYDIYFTYPDNRMACATDFLPDGTVDYVRERDWFTVAAGNGETFYSTPYLDSDSGKPIITISKAVFRDNKLQGVLAADIFVDVLVKIISEAQIAEDSYAFLVDQNLGMIVHPNEAYAFSDTPHNIMEVQGAPYADVISKIRSGSGEMVYVEDYDGIVRGIIISRMENTGWYVGIATDKTVLMQGKQSLKRGFLIAGFTAVLVSVFASVLLSVVLNRLKNRYEHKIEAASLDGEKIQTFQSVKKPVTVTFWGKKKSRRGEMRKTTRYTGSFNMLATILVIFLLMVCMVLYTNYVIRTVAVANIR